MKYVRLYLPFVVVFMAVMPGYSAPEIIRFVQYPGEVPRYDKFEVKMEVRAEYENPYFQ
ncbi:MAG: hypothetical protein OEX02_17620 [Cyclobacteriaceae bacterium]|nr:hypothetical protein [Cyclobacteriaceae bacterium]